MKKILVKVFLMSLISSKAYSSFLKSSQDFLLDPFGECKIESYRVALEEPFFYSYSTYTPKKTSPSKAMLIMPPTGGKNVIDKGYAAMFCKAGYKVYILENWEGLYERNLDFKMHQFYQDRAQKAIKAMLSDIKEERIHVLGASAGAINFSVTLGVPEVVRKVDKFMAIVSGAPLCKVIANAGETGLRGLRAERMEKLQINSIYDYENKICENLKWDIAKEKPEHLKMGMVISMDDQTVFTKFQEEQFKRMSPEFSLRVNASHKGTVIRSYLLYRKKIRDFFLN